MKTMQDDATLQERATAFRRKYGQVKEWPDSAVHEWHRISLELKSSGIDYDHFAETGEFRYHGRKAVAFFPASMNYLEIDAWFKARGISYMKFSLRGHYPNNDVREMPTLWSFAFFTP